MCKIQVTPLLHFQFLKYQASYFLPSHSNLWTTWKHSVPLHQTLLLLNQLWYPASAFLLENLDSQGQNPKPPLKLQCTCFLFEQVWATLRVFEAVCRIWYLRVASSHNKDLLCYQQEEPDFICRRFERHPSVRLNWYNFHAHWYEGFWDCVHLSNIIHLMVLNIYSHYHHVCSGFCCRPSHVYTLSSSFVQI